MSDPSRELYHALRDGDDTKVADLIESHGDFTKVVNEYGYTALGVADCGGDAPARQKLWQMKTQPLSGQKTNDGSTALHLGNMDCIVFRGGKQN